MTPTVFFVAALLAAEPAPVPVTVKVLYGTGDESQKAEIEPWISKAVAEAGSPIAAPYTDWIVLTDDLQELYASMMGGRLIKGKAVSKDGNIEVEISGFKIGALNRTITLKPGERTVVKLTDYPAPNNVFIALTTKEDDRKVGVGKAAPLRATTGRKETGIRFLTEDDASIFDITSTTGIDKATIKRESDEWPKTILVRLHLGGLESFKAGGKGFAIEWSVASAGEHEVRSSLVSGKRVADIKKDSPFYSEVRIVGGEKKIPLKDGYFEVPLPGKLFEGNPQEITLEWIDFYRN